MTYKTTQGFCPACGMVMFQADAVEHLRTIHPEIVKSIDNAVKRSIEISERTQTQKKNYR